MLLKTALSNSGRTGRSTRSKRNLQDFATMKVSYSHLKGENNGLLCCTKEVI